MRIMTSLPHYHGPTMSSRFDEGKLMIIFVRGIEREVVFTFEVFHDSISIMSEDLGFTEEDEIRLMDLHKMFKLKIFLASPSMFQDIALKELVLEASTEVVELSGTTSLKKEKQEDCQG